MFKYLSLIPIFVYILTIIHLFTFSLKIQISKYIIDQISQFNKSDKNYNIYWYLIGLYVASLIVNKIHTDLLYYIKKYINEISAKLYKRTLENYNHKKNNYDDIKCKDLENTIAEINTFIGIIYEIFILTIPKVLIYTIYYMVAIFNHSIISGIILLTIDVFVIFFYKYRNTIKENIYRDLYQSNLELKNNQKRYLIDEISINDVDICINQRTNNKNLEINYLCNEFKYSDFINNTVELMIFLIGIKLLILNEIKAFELIFISTKAINFINHTITVFEQINIETTYRTQLTNLDEINNSKTH